MKLRQTYQKHYKHGKLSAANPLKYLNYNSVVVCELTIALQNAFLINYEPLSNGFSLRDKYVLAKLSKDGMRFPFSKLQI